MPKLTLLPLLALVAASGLSALPANENPGRKVPRLIAAVQFKMFYADWTTSRDYWDAEKYCQEFDLTIASVQSDAQFDALNNAFNNLHFNGAHWLSGGDVNACNCFYSLQNGSSMGTLPCLLGIGTLCEGYQEFP